MPGENCDHHWSIENLRQGYLVFEGCARCGSRLAFFSAEERPPVESYAEGEHIWKYLGDSQAVKFDLSCDRCGAQQSLQNVMGLMLCTACDRDCPAGAATRIDGPEQTWVYIALCADTSHNDGRCVTEAETGALTEYFGARIRSPNKRVVFLPCRVVPDINTCEGHVISDTGMTSLY